MKATLFGALSLLALPLLMGLTGCSLAVDHGDSAYYRDGGYYNRPYDRYHNVYSYNRPLYVTPPPIVRRDIRIRPDGPRYYGREF